MKNKLFGKVGLVLAATALSLASCSDDEVVEDLGTRLEFSVVDPQGAPVSFAAVILYDSEESYLDFESKGVAASGNTDMNGKITFINLEEKVYYFDVIKQINDTQLISNLSSTHKLETPLMKDELNKSKVIVQESTKGYIVGYGPSAIISIKGSDLDYTDAYKGSCEGDNYTVYHKDGSYTRYEGNDVCSGSAATISGQYQIEGKLLKTTDDERNRDYDITAIGTDGFTATYLDGTEELEVRIESLN